MEEYEGKHGEKKELSWLPDPKLRFQRYQHVRKSRRKEYEEMS